MAALGGDFGEGPSGGAQAGRARWRCSPDVVLHYQSLQEPPARVRALRQFLSDDEIERAERFAASELRDRFVVSRGYLREVLAGLLGVTPADIGLSLGRFGKPFISEPAHSKVRFSLSHCSTYAVVAISGGPEVGVDIEDCRHLDDCIDVGQLVLAPAELCQLAQLDGAAQEEAFRRLWVCKEAVCKADGRGLSLDLRAFVVPTGLWLEASTASERREVVRADGRDWLVELRRDAPDRHVAALAIDAEGCRPS